MNNKPKVTFKSVTIGYRDTVIQTFRATRIGVGGLVFDNVFGRDYVPSTWKFEQAHGRECVMQYY